MHYKNIPLDKVYHFVAGFIISIAVVLFTGLAWAGLIAGFLAGLFKELYDQYSYKGGDFFDFFATLAGTFAGVIIFELIGG